MKFLKSKEMRSRVLFVSYLALTWVAATEAILFEAGLVVGALAALKGVALTGVALKGLALTGAALKGAALVGFVPRSQTTRYTRSVDFSEANEDILLSAVKQLDPSGCILKLLCQLQFGGKNFRTFEENRLVDLFANAAEERTNYNAAFIYAIDVGKKGQDPLVCNKFFSRCSLTEVQLRNLLQQAWGCDATLSDGITTNEEMSDFLRPNIGAQEPLKVQEATASDSRLRQLPLFEALRLPPTAH
ncbi:hypothetical protein SK128_010379 [Halocaridina rubra]|uniref:Uncharacterized protein n=1 Tax=Halocaridina rubra TaxID=373956 RepID=A0AAN8WEB2_HALRR